MRTGLTKRQKTTEIFFDETKSRITVYTHNTDLKKRLTAENEAEYAKLKAQREVVSALQNQKSQYRPMSHRRKETTMNKNKEFEHEIDPELLEEIRLWEEADHDELTEYYFSCSDPYLKPQPLPPDHVRHNCYFAKGDRRHTLHRHRQL